MKKILITGANGFIGKNLLTVLKTFNKYEVISITKNNSEEELKHSLLKADFIVHLAGVNRPKYAKEFYEGNKELTKKIVDILKDNNKITPILITSSIQATLENDYGKSKKQAEEELIKYSDENNTKVYIFRLPNVFGKWCKPNYNSAVATFCYNIAHDLDVWVKDPTIEVKLVYIDDVVSSIVSIIDDTLESIYYKQLDKYYYEVSTTYVENLGNIVENIYMFKSMRNNLMIPNLKDQFIKALYSTYLSYLDEDNFSYCLDKKEDNRGYLVELIKSQTFGQIFISKTHPQIVRGNHYHHTKVEKFIVVKGEAKISFRRIDEDEVIEYFVSGDNPQVLDIPPGYTHSIENIGKGELITLFWANEIFDQQNPDTYFDEVNKQ